MKFGDYLRARREDKGWTQPEAAAKADIEQSYLSKLETGKSFPSQDVFERLAAAYGFDAETLAQSVDADSLKALREVGQVRAAVISLQSRSVRLARSWLAAGVAVNRLDLSRNTQIAINVGMALAMLIVVGLAMGSALFGG